uniref:Zinc finger BED domain-containing protein 1 n=1 Tax=Cacopsylla melanoneura TaxID=428564 RepID=A0A8D8VZ86_9HEMI
MHSGSLNRATKIVSAEKDIVLSKLNYVMEELLAHTKVLKNIECSPQLTEFHGVLYKECVERFSRLEMSSSKCLLNEATVLDPRLKNHGFGIQGSYKETRKSIELRCVNIVLHNNSTSTATTSTIPTFTATTSTASTSTAITSTPVTATDDCFWNKFDGKVNNLVHQNTPPVVKVITEIDRYIAEPLLQRDEDPLKWWEQCKTVYPTLYELMLKRMCLQATSVPSERVFSKSGEILNAKRSRLTNSRFSQIVFLNCNLK